MFSFAHMSYTVNDIWSFLSVINENKQESLQVCLGFPGLSLAGSNLLKSQWL